MCHLNLLFRKKMNVKVTPFVMAVSSASFLSQNDGEGIYYNSNHTVHKNKNKMNLFEFENEIEDSNVILSHQRTSTSGFDIKYNHPFANEDFVMVHNGIINKFKGNEGSDTYGFWLKFNEEFNKITRHISREDKVKKVISRLFQKDEGSYSILIYDKKTKQSFYFKGEGYPSIYFYSSDEYLFISTTSQNEIFLPMLTNKKFHTLEIKGRILYKINDKFLVYKILELPKTKYEYVTNYNNVSTYSKSKNKCDVCQADIIGDVFKLRDKEVCFDCAEYERTYCEDEE